MRTATVLLMLGGLQAIVASPESEPMPTAEAAEDAKPSNERLRKDLLRRMEKDQAARKAVIRALEKGAVKDSASAKRLREIDRRNTERMKRIVDRYGWPGKSLVGADGAHAAWILVQHADHDRPFQRRCLNLLTEAVKKGEASGEDLAYLTDRVRVGDDEKQVYGTQLREVDGQYEPFPIEDELNVDARRKSVGLPPLADYLNSAQALLEETSKNEK